MDSGFPSHGARSSKVQLHKRMSTEKIMSSGEKDASKENIFQSLTLQNCSCLFKLYLVCTVSIHHVAPYKYVQFCILTYRLKAKSSLRNEGSKTGL